MLTAAELTESKADQTNRNIRQMNASYFTLERARELRISVGQLREPTVEAIKSIDRTSEAVIAAGQIEAWPELGAIRGHLDRALHLTEDSDDRLDAIIAQLKTQERGSR